MQIKDSGIETWINEYEPSAKFNLTNTCVGILSVGELLNFCSDKDKEELCKLQLGYGEVFGTERLKSNIASLYETADLKNVSLAHGAVGANSLVMLSLLERGDEIVSILPIYEQHYSIPESIGAKVKKIFLKEENNWLPDLDELKMCVTDKTKLICINNPNNPTGALMDKDFLNSIVEIARSVGAYILCDEVYRGLTHSGNPFCASIFDLYEKGISTSSMSKTFSLPGLRVGWIVAKQNIIDKINIQRNYHVICVGRINDFFASVAIENKDEIISKNLNICNNNLKNLDDWINSQSFISYVKPKAGTTAFLKYNFSISSKELCKNLQKDTGVMFLPGSTMDMENYLRIGYTSNWDMIGFALDKFSDWVNKNL